ncbi:PEGA domain-containing protein [Candidatus Saccharibacteria bacterium]|nr:PEGA domain-containing protein [Candidatus Saccharibacteria bacterium]
MNSQPWTTRRIIQWFIVIALIGAIAWSVIWYLGRHATVVIQYNIANAPSVIVSVDGEYAEPVSTTKTSAEYHLKPGEHQLVMKLDGYQSLTVSINGSDGQKYIINGNLRPKANTKITSLIDIHGLDQVDSKVNSIKYFYDNTWAVLNLTPPGTDPGWLVVSYNAQDRAWVNELGPSTSFYDYQVAQLPSYVKTYLGNSLAGGYQQGGHD